ncbi:MAG: Uma2 family endonuclease [Deltaproteobacteria bacterium]|nr:Uma2 family endonuclease [Deltaproteobacteria bacterium]
MVAVAQTQLVPEEPEEQADACVVLRDVPWSVYKALDAARGENPRPRFYYFEGVLEIMNTSRRHENVKTTIGRIIELYADSIDVELEGTGSFTLERAKLKRAAEADESYFVGPGSAEREMPDLAIEVVLTSGGINKLALYKSLGVREVWFWYPKKKKLAVHVLAGSEYEARSRSSAFPELDLDLVASCVSLGDQIQAVRAFKQSLQNPPSSP